MPKRAENPTAECLACRTCGCKHREHVYTLQRRRWTVRVWECRNCGRRRTTYEVPGEMLAPALPPPLARAVPSEAPPPPPMIHEPPEVIGDDDPFAPVAIDAPTKKKRAKPKKTPAPTA